MNAILKALNEKFISASAELQMILAKCSLVGCEIADYLLEKRALTVLMENLLEKDAATNQSSKLVFPTKPS